MKIRILSLLLIVALIPAFLAVSVDAASVSQSPLIDLYQYNLGISAMSGSYSYFSGWEFGVSNASLTFPLAAKSAVYYVDIVLALGNGWPPSLSFKVFDSSLTAVYFGPYNNYVRVYGPVVSPLASNSSITLTISQPSSDFMLYGSVLSFKYSSSRELYSDVSAFAQVSSEAQYFPTLKFSFPSSTSVSQVTDKYYPYVFSISCDEWKTYDYLSFVLEVDSYEITSIIVGDGSFLYSIDYLIDAYGDARQRFIVTADLTQADRSNSSFFIKVLGVCKAESTANLPLNADNTWRIVSATGSFKSSAPSPEVSWLQRVVSSIESWGQKIVDALDPQNDSSASDALVNKGQQIQDFEQQHQEVINGSTGMITDTLDLTGFAPALSLVSTYTSSVFNILGPYQQVFILPISIAIILFICSRAPGNSIPRLSNVSRKSHPDSVSSDQVVS